MSNEIMTRQAKQRTIVKAALLNPKNLFVLGVGILSGAFFSLALVPLGILAYGMLCYLDFSSEEFVKKILRRFDRTEDIAAEAEFKREISAPSLKIKELQQLRDNITGTQEKIHVLYSGADVFTRGLLGDLAQIEELIERSHGLLLKAQDIRVYLASENIAKVNQDVTLLEEKIQNVRDDFSKQQYQQALDARHKQLETFRDIQQVYERLVSQVTNISMSLESMYFKMMKLKTAEYSLAKAESDQVAEQLTGLLGDVEQLDSALNDHLSLPGRE